MPFAILQVVREFSLAGGSETVAFEIQKAWEKAGVKASVLANVVADGAHGPNIRRIAPWLGWIGTRGRLRYFGRLIAVPLFTILATFAIRKESDSVVLSHGDTLRGDVLVVHAVNKASLAVKRAAGSMRWMLNPMHLWVAWRDRMMIGGLRFSRYVAVSNRIAGELSLYYGVPAARIAVIPNGINLGRFAPVQNARATVRGEFAIPSDAPLLLFVGHEFGRKGLAPIVSALSLLRPDVRLLVVGADDPTPYRKLAQAAGVSDRVTFAGPRGDLSTLYQASDAFVLPTAYESFSLVCMEAMACGLPVFATRVGGIEDYLVDGVNGHTITHEPADIATKLAALLDDPAGHERLRNGARATAQDFGWDRIARLYAELLEDVYRERSNTVQISH
jgi:UDP-glucose:(heptosyl)LPS alpha-1,3-glucosyltransferase